MTVISDIPENFLKICPFRHVVNVWAVRYVDGVFGKPVSVVPSPNAQFQTFWMWDTSVTQWWISEDSSEHVGALFIIEHVGAFRLYCVVPHLKQTAPWK